MNLIKKTCTCALFCLNNKLPKEIIEIIIKMMLTSKIKPYLNGNKIIVIKDGLIYENNLTDDHDIYLNRSNHKNVRSILFPESFSTYEIDIPNRNIKIKYGMGFGMYLTKEGLLFSKGTNYCGQLGWNDVKESDAYGKINLPKVIKFWCGIDNSCALTVDGLYVWGSIESDIQPNSRINSLQNFGQKNVIKVCCGISFGIILCTDAIYGYGKFIYMMAQLDKGYQIESPIKLEINKAHDIINVSACMCHTFILTSYGEIYTLVGITFARVSINATNIIDIKCVGGGFFTINDNLDIQLWDNIKLQHQKIMLRDNASQQNETSMTSNVSQQNITQDVSLLHNDNPQQNETSMTSNVSQQNITQDVSLLHNDNPQQLMDHHIADSSQQGVMPHIDAQNSINNITTQTQLDDNYTSIPIFTILTIIIAIPMMIYIFRK